MSDRSILALDYDSEVTFAQIAGSPDSSDPDSLYVLHRGRLGLEVANHLLDSELPAVDTSNARVYAKQGGRYQVHSDGDGWTEVTVLDGFAEVVTQRGSAIVRGGEVILVRGVDDPWIDLQTGSGPAVASLDDWTEGHRARLEAYAAVDADGYRSTLNQHGRWVDIEDRRAWKPDVDDDWQPYSRGRWTDTPAGLYWVARDPWGPLPYHYGSWNLHPGYGWLWFPSAIYGPSHVYWYWGPSYVGWIPRGYYQHYYRGRGFRTPFGLYGWAGGFWDPFNTWIFCPTGYVGYGRGYTYGRSLRRRHPKLERGLITTDTNGIDRRNWQSPESVEEILLSKRRDIVDRDLPDVTDFVARRPDLNETLRTQLRRSDADPAVAAVPRVIASPSRRGLVGVTAGGVRTQPAAQAPAVVKGTGSGGTEAKPPSRVAAPRSSGSASDRSRRPTPARRVLDAIRGRAAAPSSPRSSTRQEGQPKRASTPRTPTPRVQSTPRTSTPKASSTPRTRSTPRTSTPRSAPPRTRSTPPRASTPKASSTPRTRSTPRTSTPRSAPPRTRSTPPRASTPKASSTPRTRSTPRTSTPRSTPPRTRSTTRSSSPRSSSPPTRSYSPPSRSSSSSPPRASSPPPSRSSSPPPSSSARTPPFRR